MNTSTESVDMTEADIKRIVTEAVKAAMPARHQSAPTDAYEIEFPIACRSGNLAVHQKQLLNVIMKKDQDADIPESLLKSANERGELFEKRMLAQGRKVGSFTAGGANAGADLMNVSLSSVLLERLYLNSELASRMISQEIVMPTDPFYMPLTTTRPQFYAGVPELTAPTATGPGTARPMLQSHKLAGMIPVSDEAGEDSVIPVLPMITGQLGLAAAQALENAILNGDENGTQDLAPGGGAIPAGDSSLLFDGIRKLVLAQAALKVSLATGGISAANFGAIRKALGKWGTSPSQLLWVLGTKGVQDTILLSETLTAEKSGGRAFAGIATGTAPSLFGIPIVPSEFVLEDVNSAGVFDNSTTTKGLVYLIHLPSWLQGVRRGMTVESFRDARAGATWLICSFRRAFMPMESLANTRAAAIGLNYNS